MKTINTCLASFIFIFFFSINAHSQQKNDASDLRMDGIYKCKDWHLIDEKIDNPMPAYYRFFPDGVMLFCEYENPKNFNKDSIVSDQEIFNTVLTQATLDKIKDNMSDDPANVYRTVGKFKVTAYKYQKISAKGLCFDILSERPNCLGKPNLKIVESTLLKTDDGTPADDRYFKFVELH